MLIASTSDGGAIRERPGAPADLAATIYRHMECRSTVATATIEGILGALWKKTVSRSES